MGTQEDLTGEDLSLGGGGGGDLSLGQEQGGSLTG